LEPCHPTNRTDLSRHSNKEQKELVKGGTNKKGIIAECTKRVKESDGNCKNATKANGGPR